MIPAAAGFTVVWTAVAAERPNISTYGTPGVVELPSARALPDGELSFSSAILTNSSRHAVTFQVFPRVTGTFRYSIVQDFTQGDGPMNRLFDNQLFDRSFDVQFQILEEEKAGIDLAVGLRDFIGTGIFSSEYIVATRSFGEAVEVSAGMGWGRLAGEGSFDNPLGVLSDSFSDRAGREFENGGNVEASQWFRGDASLFLGVDWAVSDKTNIQLEYSPDFYERELLNSDVEIATPINAGIQYRFDNDATLQAYVIGGENIGAQLNFFLDPDRRLVAGDRDPAPQLIAAQGRTAANSWADTQGVSDALSARLQQEGLRLDGLDVNGTVATLYVENQRWDVEAQAAGRAARAMAATLPGSVQTFTVIFQEGGLPLNSVTTQRADLETYQSDYEGSWRTLSRAQIGGAGVAGQAPARFEYSLSPYLALSLFDPQAPIRWDVGPQADISYRAAPGLSFAGRFRYPLAGNLDESERNSDSVLPRVRSEGFLYARESEFEVNKLTAEYLWRPNDETFARVTGGYLESMFGGVSAEVLWRPIDSRFAWGAEWNYARQRDFDMLFGFQDYDVFTGHASVYYDIGNSYFARVDAGRYLAGDWGATVAVDREFNNGVRVGGFFTLTDVPFDDFGEGSFDKGIEIEFPLSYFTGQQSQLSVTEAIRPVVRDGGARLQVDNRLYGLTRDYGGPELSDGWGRYLR